MLIPSNGLARSLLVVGGVTILTATAVLAVGIRFSAAGRPSTYVSAPGTVTAVDFHEDAPLSIGTIRDTDIRFAYSDPSSSQTGQQQLRELVFRSTYGTGNTQVGDSVPVYYDPEDPAGTAETDADRRGGFWTRIVSAAALLFLGGIFFLAGFLSKSPRIALK